VKIGCVKEIKTDEYRVGLTPGNARAYIERGHTVALETGAGLGAGFNDEMYRAAGVRIEPAAKKLWDDSDMIVKVKEPLNEEFDYLHEGLILFTYLHLASVKSLAQQLMDKKVSAVAYETIADASGSLPCLKPMSEIAGRLSIQEGAKYLERPFGGSGILLSGVPGVDRGNVLIIGGGVVGTSAMRIALGIGAIVTVIDMSIDRLTYLEALTGGAVRTLYSSRDNIEEALSTADLVIGAVLIPGKKAPQLVSADMIKIMKKRSVIIDVAIDQGGCIESSRPTTHNNPIFMVDEILHYGVTNMPSAVSRTSTMALTNSTLPYGLKLAEMGVRAMSNDEGLLLGLNTMSGYCTNKGVADSLGFEYTQAKDLLL
jgi:alanine dehydrogenase